MIRIRFGLQLRTMENYMIRMRFGRQPREAQVVGCLCRKSRLRLWRIEAFGGTPVHNSLRYLLVCPIVAEAPHFIHQTMSRVWSSSPPCAAQEVNCSSPRFSKSFKEVPRVSKSFQELPRVTRSFQEFPRVSKGFQELPRVS